MNNRPTAAQASEMSSAFEHLHEFTHDMKPNVLLATFIELIENRDGFDPETLTRAGNALQRKAWDMDREKPRND